MNWFLYIMGAILMAQHLHVVEKGKERNKAIHATYALATIFWPLSMVIICVISLFMLWGKNG